LSPQTIFCVYNTLQISLLWHVVRDRVLVRLPKNHTVAAFSNTDLGNVFAFKHVLNGPSSVWFIITVCASLVITAHWFRAAEHSACLLATTTSPECKLYRATFWKMEWEGVWFE